MRPSPDSNQARPATALCLTRISDRVTSTRYQLHEELHMSKFTIQGSAIALLAFSICIALVLTVGACAQQAPMAGTESTAKNVVLVHGAFADDSSYAQSNSPPESKGLHV